jgi:hypothetical protein
MRVNLWVSAVVFVAAVTVLVVRHRGPRDGATPADDTAGVTA